MVLYVLSRKRRAVILSYDFLELWNVVVFDGISDDERRENRKPKHFCSVRFSYNLAVFH
jgi:hypothetical protein